MTCNRALLLSLFSVLLTCSLSHAQESLSGPLAGTLEPGVYDVTGDISVEAGDTLRILPPASLRFSFSRGLEVRGCLQAVGTPADSIFFESGNATEWDGLLVDYAESDTSLFEHCRFTDAVYGAIFRAKPESIIFMWRHTIRVPLSLFTTTAALPGNWAACVWTADEQALTNGLNNREYANILDRADAPIIF